MHIDKGVSQHLKRRVLDSINYTDPAMLYLVELTLISFLIQETDFKNYPTYLEPLGKIIDQTNRFQHKPAYNCFKARYYHLMGDQKLVMPLLEEAITVAKLLKDDVLVKRITMEIIPELTV